MAIRTKYVIALCLIALMVTSSAVFMQLIFTQQKGDAEIINVAGQQRMLSQRIALYAMRLITDGNASDREVLKQSLQVFTDNHTYLSAIEDKPERVSTLYYGGVDLDARVISFISQTRQLLDSPNPDMLPDELQADVTGALLVDLDTVVKAFETAANMRVARVERIEMLLWLFTLVLLVIEAIFIFRPMENQIYDKIAKLQHARDKAEHAEKNATQANKAKSEFLASMSHELRTPMNGMFGMMELALDNPDKTSVYLRKAKNAGKQLLTLINDLLDFSKIEAGKVTLENRSFNLIQVIDEVVSVQEVHCRGQGLEFVFEKATHLPAYVVGDATRLAQMLHNLLNNAVKFTETGKVILKAATYIRDKRPWLSFTVIDTGIGIPEDKLTKVFAKFSQADQSTTRKFGGTGLGLAITQSLVELMDGNINVESEVGKGSTFTLSFPVEIDSRKHAPEVESCDIHVAVVDDLSTSCEYLSHVIETLGMQASCFQSPVAYLNSESSFDILLLDVAMPEMDGLTMLEKLVEQSSGRPPYVIFVTAVADQLSIPETLKAYVWQIHPKPLQRHELEKDLLALKALLTQDPSTDDPSKREDGATILLAEDNEINAEIARTMLEQEGHSVTLATDGQKAVNACKYHRFDLILMDMNMPVMDGIDATLQIRQTLKINTPIVALTANAFSEDRERCEAAGMVGFLSKPIDKHQLLECVSTITSSAKATL